MNDTSDLQSIPKGHGRPVLRQFGAKLCISITLAIVMLAAVECAFYLHAPLPDVPPNDYKAYVIWQTARPVIATTHLDAEGLRKTDYTHCDAGQYTIWMFGGSGMWGQQLLDSETIASQVARRFEDSGHPACVKNYGQVGYGNTQEVIKLMLELKRAARKPDAVTFYDGTVDAFLPYESDEPDVHYGFPVLKKKFESPQAGDRAGFEYLQSTNTYTGLLRIARNMQLVHRALDVRHLTEEEAASMARRTLDNYTKNMEILDVLAAHFGFQYACYWEPWIESSPKKLSPAEEAIRTHEKEINLGTLQVWHATYDLFHTVERPRLINLSDIFKDRSDTIFVDRGHVNALGAQMIADRFTEGLQRFGSQPRSVNLHGF